MFLFRFADADTGRYDGSARTYLNAEVAADACAGIHLRFTVLEADRLMTGIAAGQITSAAADTFITQEFRIDDTGAIQFLRRNDIVDRCAADLAERGESVILQIERHA